MEQFRQIGEVLGSINALMVLQDDILVNQKQCCLLLEIFSLAFNTIAEEIRQNLKLEEKHSKWRSLEQPLKELHRVFKEGESYIKHCMDNSNWWCKVINLHQNKDCVEFHIHNLLSYFPSVIEAIESAGEISGLDPSEMERRRVVFSRKYDKEWNDPKLFQWRFGKQYLIPKDICNKFEHSWREDRWNLVESLQEKRKSSCNEIEKTEKRLADLLLKKLTGLEQFNGKLFPISILIDSKDYTVKKRLTPNGQYKEIHWLGDSFTIRHFFGEIEPLSSEISSLLSLSHSNILQYLCGFYDEERKECYLVMELMHKDLQSYMKENYGPRRRYLFSVPVVIDIMLQIARGMEYLHGNQIFHGDLNPMNILLKERNQTEGYFHAKITGFGLKNQSCSRSDSVIWYAPEVLSESSKSKVTEKSDVYSFAMVCFELITGKVPFEDSHLQEDEMVKKNIIMGERPLFPIPSPKYLVSLVKHCWHSEANQRPSFSSICRILRYIKKFLVINQDHTHSQIPLNDCWDLEARFLKSFPGDSESVNQIPFQIYSYRVLEKEKMNLNSEISESEDTSSEYSDTRSVSSEIDMKNVSGKVRSIGSSSVKGRTGTKGATPLNQFGRSMKARKDNRLPVSPMNPLSPRRRRQQQTGHASDSELT